MKHIFTIHSPITFLAAVGTMIHENLPTENVVLVCGGGYEPKFNEDFKGSIVKSYEVLEASFSFLAKLKNWNYTKSANHYIDQLLQGEDFIAYIDLMSIFNRYLVMHPKCKQFHIIEEGIVNYADYDDFMLWTADLRQFQWQWNGFGSIKHMLNACVRLFRGRSLRLLAMPIHPNLYTLHKDVNAYCFSDDAFRYTPAKQKKVLAWDSLKKLIPLEGTQYPDGSWFWIGDTLCKSYGISLSHFEHALQQLLEKINPAKEERIIHVKFRGAETAAEQQLTLSYLQQYNFKIEMVPVNEIMEAVFLNHKDFQVCGIASSLLIYAHFMGHHTHSVYPYIPDEYGVSLNRSYLTISKKTGLL